eukprot:Skav224458  [mRNA]  locus=scaffold1302:55988:58674:- [translate_table: standard]
MLLQMSPSRSVLLDVLVDLHQQVSITGASVHHVFRLAGKVLARKDHINVAHQIFEECGVLCSTSNHIQRTLDVDFGFFLFHVDEAPARLFEKDVVELGQHWGIGRWNVEGVTPL